MGLSRRISRTIFAQQSASPVASSGKIQIRVKKSRLEFTLLAWVLPILLLTAWTLLSVLEIVNPYFYPPPHLIFDAAWNLTVQNHLLPGIVASLWRILFASLISSLISIPLGIKMASNEYWRALFDPLVKLRYLPAFALMPLLILFVGVDETNKILFLIISITLYFLPSVILAVDSVPNELIDTARTLGASEGQVVTKILIPAAMPDICQSFVIISGIGWNALMVAEIINAKQGLGHIMNMARQRGQMDAVIVALIIIYLFAVVMDWGIRKGIRRFFAWKYD